MEKNQSLINKVSPFASITEGQKYIITKNLPQLIQMVLKDAAEFQSTQIQKLKALQQLKMICCIADIGEYLTQIFKLLAKIYTNDDKYYLNECKQICYVIGLKIQIDYYLPTMINQARFELQAQQSKTLCNLINMISETIVHENDNLDLQSLVHLIGDIESVYSDCWEVMECVYYLENRIIGQSQQELPIYVRQLFQALLTIRSFNKMDCEPLLNQLSTKCGYTSVTDLHANEISLILEQIVNQEHFKTWKHNTREFLKFKAIVTGCGDGISKYMQQIIQIMKYSLGGDQEVELRLEVLLLLDKVVQIQSIKETIKMYAAVMISQLLIQSMVWKSNKPTVKVRKAAVIITLYLSEMLTQEEILELFPALAAPLKSCMTDDWAPDLRFASSKLATSLIKKCQILNYEIIRDFYPSLLERLDDSQNQIRIEITYAIAAIMQQKYDSTTILEYIVKATLIHLDDSSEEVQRAVFECLLKCPEKGVVLKEAEQAVKNFKYPRLCQELIKLVS
ncbi:unnamed protein product [Paramecium pentaurelia]|uniref:Dynein axonemal assembly factor 5 HEAT-repeat domain-containing protein n=1 Tax=Paramecium pentaurelia TaxID=43138 RepID=A0A8S1VV96_9CILI|nr:unnamed protein product [Paramecium pentaurelia]